MTQYVISLVVLGLGLVVAVWVARRRSRELDAATAARKALEADLIAAGERAARHERRANEFFSIIEGIELERDTWRKIYFESSYQSGAAQAWLARDLDGAVLRANAFAVELRKRGVKASDVVVDPALRQVLADYGLNHPEGNAKGIETAPGLDAAKRVQAELGDKTEAPPAE